MYLSMWILADSLKEYGTDLHIMSGEMCIRGVSLLFSGPRYYSHIVYVGPSDEFIQTMPGKVICVNKDDYFIVDCDSVEEVYLKLMETLDFYMEWDLSMRDRIDENCDLQEITEKGAEILQSMIGVMNTGFIMQAVGGKKYAGDISVENLNDLQLQKGLPLAHVTTYADVLRDRLNTREPYYFREPILDAVFYTKNIMLNGWLWGFCFMTLRKNEVLTECRRQLFLVLDEQLHRWREHSGIRAKEPEQPRFFLGLLKADNSIDHTDAIAYLNRIGWSETDEKHLCIIREQYGNALIYSRLIHQISQTFSDCYVVQYDGSVVLIINTSHLPLEALTAQLPVILYGSEIRIGISYPFQNLFHLPQYLEQAQIALETAFRKSLRICLCSDCAVSYTRNLIRKKQTVNLEHPVAKQIRRYDREHGTEYYITLQTYIMEERSIQRTAAALHIHKNTLLYRLRKLNESFPLQLDNREERFRLILNYLIYSDYAPEE